MNRQGTGWFAYREMVTGRPQVRVLNAISALYAANGRVQMRDIAAALDLPVSNVHHSVEILREFGLVSSAKTKAQYTLRPTFEVVMKL